MESVIRTAKDALQARVSAFLSAKHPLIFEDDDRSSTFSTIYLKLLRTMSEVQSLKGGRQSPLVNAGYAMRVGTIQVQILRFFQFHRPRKQPRTTVTQNTHQRLAASGETTTSGASYPPLRIIVLGAGLDVMALACLASFYHLHVIEIDLPEICTAKQEALQDAKFQGLLPKVSGQSDPQAEKQFQLMFHNTQSTYSLLAGNLKDVESVKCLFRELPDIDLSIPTLILSELVVSYLPPKSRHDLLQWICMEFLSNSSAMILYEPVGELPTSTNKNNIHLSTSVATGYRQSYLERFQAKLDRGKVVNPQQQSCSLYPLAIDPFSVAAQLEPLRVDVITAAQACFHSLPWHDWISTELFDEHAALRLYLRCYCLVHVFHHSQTTSILPRIMCPWSSCNPRVLPLVCQVSLSAASLSESFPATIWITPIQSEDEPQVCQLFTCAYQHLFVDHPSVHKMVKTALKKDLALSSPTISSATAKKGESAIGKYYRERSGVFLVAVTSNSDTQTREEDLEQILSPRVVGSIGIRKWLASEKGIRQQHAGGTWEIHRLFVHSDYRSQGIAQQLLQRALDVTITTTMMTHQNTPAPYVVATTLVLLEPATRFYERHQFDVVEETTIATLKLRTYGKHLSQNS